MRSRGGCGAAFYGQASRRADPAQHVRSEAALPTPAILISSGSAKASLGRLGQAGGLPPTQPLCTLQLKHEIMMTHTRSHSVFPRIIAHYKLTQHHAVQLPILDLTRFLSCACWFSWHFLKKVLNLTDFQIICYGFFLS